MAARADRRVILYWYAAPFTETRHGEEAIVVTICAATGATYCLRVVHGATVSTTPGGRTVVVAIGKGYPASDMVWRVGNASFVAVGVRVADAAFAIVWTEGTDAAFTFMIAVVMLEQRLGCFCRPTIRPRPGHSEGSGSGSFLSQPMSVIHPTPSSRVWSCRGAGEFPPHGFILPQLDEFV